ncbi:ATP-binding protein [Bifidobacterium longum]|uniref:ATP-binding protein n=1 Tax=Bifidobacterium longum TaxID=216816 RepID=UPI001F40D3BE|nr:ATP-binding protein [Bifidobacterium longum]
MPAAARDCGAWGVSATLLSLGGIDALNNSDTVFVADFLRELFGNIARYADSTQRYVVLVSAAQDRVTIDVTDRPRQGGTTLEGRHSGLAYYRERVLHAHGDWDVREKRGQWVLHASVPVDNAG